MKPLALFALAVILVAAPALASPKGLDENVSVDFVDTPVPEALAYVAAVTGVHVITDPEVGDPDFLVTMKLRDMHARAVLNGITSGARLVWDERWGGVFVATTSRLETIPKESLPLPADGEEKPESAALRKILATKTVSFKFAESPVMDCLEYVRSIASLNIVVDDAIRSKVDGMSFTGSVAKATVGDALSVVLRPRGLTAELIDGLVFVRKAGPKPVTPKKPEKKGVPKVLDETKVSVNFLDTPLVIVLDYLSRKTGYPIHLDPYAERRSAVDYLTVSVKVAEAIPTRKILDLVTMTKGLDWDIRWGCVFVATEERLAALPKATGPKAAVGETEEWEVALRRRLEKETVTFDFDDTGLGEVLAWIRDTKKLNILLDPGAVKAAARARVRVRVTKRPIGEALTLLLAPWGFQFGLAHEVVVVRTNK